MLKLERPIVFTDVETTGTHPQVDRIVQIGVVKLYPDGKKTEWSSLVEPGMPIPPEVSTCHGITDDMVKSAPTFRELAPMLASGFMGSDFGGFNVRFDILFLKEEFKRVGATGVMDGVEIVDAYRIYVQKKPRTLTAAVKEYLGEDLIDAHDALVDARASLRVFEAQLEQHPELPQTVGELYQIFFKKPADGHLDPDGKIAWRHGRATLNFSNYATMPLEQVPRSFLNWILQKDFSPEVKHIVREALAGRFPRRD